MCSCNAGFRAGILVNNWLNVSKTEIRVIHPHFGRQYLNSMASIKNGASLNSRTSRHIKLDPFFGLKFAI